MILPDFSPLSKGYSLLTNIDYCFNVFSQYSWYNMDIFVGSTNKHKLAAVKYGLEEVFSDLILDVQGRSVSSQINAQPVGHEETVRGAINRLTDLKKMLADTHYDLLVAFENGIFSVQIGAREAWFDLGWVAVEDANGRQSLAHSTGIEFNAADVRKARQYGLKFSTVGRVIGDRLGTDTSDPHLYLTDGVVGRIELLRLGLKAAVGQLILKSPELVVFRH